MKANILLQHLESADKPTGDLKALQHNIILLKPGDSMVGHPYEENYFKDAFKDLLQTLHKPNINLKKNPLFIFNCLREFDLMSR